MRTIQSGSLTIHDLPPELLLRIFSILLSLTSSPYPRVFRRALDTGERRQVLYEIRLVCKTWLSLINNSRALWGTESLPLKISILPRSDPGTLTINALREAQMLLRHVPQFPINLQIWLESIFPFDFDTFKPFFDAIKDEVIILQIFLYPQEKDIEEIGFPFSRLPVMPKLQRIYLDGFALEPPLDAGGDSETRRLNLCSAPELTTFSSKGGYASCYLDPSGDIDAVCRWDRITNIKIDEELMSLKHLFDIVLLCHRLEIASFFVSAQTPVVPECVEQPHRLGYLKGLKVKGHGKHYHQFLDGLVLPALKKLKITDGLLFSPSGSVSIIESLIALRERSFFALEEVKFNLKSANTDPLVDFLISSPTLRSITLNIPHAFNVQLLAKPSVLPNLIHFYHIPSLPELLNITEDEFLKFLRVRMRMKGMRYLCLAVTEKLYYAESVKQLKEELKWEGRSVDLRSPRYY